MAKKQQKDFEKWATPILNKLQDTLLLHDFQPLTIEAKYDIRVVAQCELNYPYKSITIQYSESLLKDWVAGKKEKVKGVLVHEMCHPITDPLYCKSTNRFVSKDEIEDERERLTDHIANILIRADLV
jgi:hypothetical protein